MTPLLRSAGGILAAVMVTAAAAQPASSGAAPAAASADDAWYARFEEVCSKTQDAMALSSDELRSLVARCDELKASLSALDESRRKVYGKRLQLCRDLYDFMLQSREKG